MTCTGKHYDCVEQSDCLDCRYRTLATDILNEALEHGRKR